MLEPFNGNNPVIDPSAWAHESAVLIGRVKLAANASVWPNCVLRGDIEPIEIGEETSFQDLSVSHTKKGCPVKIGKRVVVGHRATVHGAVVGDGAMVGMGAVMLDGSELGAGAILAAGAVLKEGDKVPPGMVAAGVPAKVIRPVKDQEKKEIERIATEYVERMKTYKAQQRRDSGDRASGPS
jgi:carbonic anhydrase/acetyltransferase-like protein (isoleucine patch superfamily)